MQTLAQKDKLKNNDVFEHLRWDFIKKVCKDLHFLKKYKIH